MGRHKKSSQQLSHNSWSNQALKSNYNSNIIDNSPVSFFDGNNKNYPQAANNPKWNNIPAYLSEIPPTESEHPPECQPEFLDFDPFFNEEIANRQAEYNEGLDDNVGYWQKYDGNLEGLAETREIDNNAISATEGTGIPTAANLNQPSRQVAKMSVKNTGANNSIEPSKRDELPQENTNFQENQANSIPDWINEPLPDDIDYKTAPMDMGCESLPIYYDQGMDGVDNATLSPVDCGIDTGAGVETNTGAGTASEPVPDVFKTLVTKAIAKQYIGNYHQYTKGSKIAVVKSGTGTGKTTAIVPEIQRIINNNETPYVLILAPREKLCKSTSASLNVKFEKASVNAKAHHYKDVLSMTPKKRMESGVTIIVTTINSLYHFPEFFDGKRKLHRIFMDETEAHFDLLATKTKNVPLAIQCVRDCIKHAETSYLMDAHAGNKTSYLMQLFFPEESRRNSDRIIFLAGSYKKWWNHTIEIITDNSYKKSRATVYKRIIEAIERGKNIAIACVTAKEAAVITNKLKEFFPDQAIGCVVAENKKNLISKKCIGDDIIDNAKAVKLFNVIVYSPSISMGVSFDIKNHIDTVFCFAENIEQAPDAKSVMQMMARFRNLSAKHVVIALDTRHLKLTPINEKERRITFTEQIKSNRNTYSEVGKEHKTLTELENEELKLRVFYESIRVKNKNNFYEQVIKFIEHDFNPQNIKYSVAENLTDIEKAIKQERERQALIDSELTERCFMSPLDDDKAKEITFKLLTTPNKVSHEEYKALSAYKTLKSLGFDKGSSKNDLENIHQMKVSGSISAIYNNENAQMDVPTANKLVAIITYGAGESERMKKGMMNKGIFIKTERKFLSLLTEVAKDVIDKRKNKKIKTLIKFIENNKKTLDARGINTNGYTKDIERKIRKWLRDLLGYEVKKKQIRVNKKREWQYTATPSKDITEMVNRRKDKALDRGSIVKSLIRDSKGAAFLVMTREVEAEIFRANIDKREFNTVMGQAAPQMMETLNDLYIRTFKSSEPAIIGGEISSKNMQALFAVQEKIKELNSAIN